MGSCFRRKIKVEPEPEEDETDWVDGAERQNADLDKERRGEFLDKKDVEAVHKAFGEAAARFGSGSGGETLSASKLAEGHGESRGNPLAKRIFASFSEKQDGTLGKEDWVAACCVLSSGGSKANKARTAFQARRARRARERRITRCASSSVSFNIRFVFPGRETLFLYSIRKITPFISSRRPFMYTSR